MSAIPCESCGYDVPLERERCPHCARPGLFPNVRAAQVETEREALDLRYRAAVAEATARGCDGVVQSFEAAVGTSTPVIARPLTEVERLAASDQQLHSTFYKLLDADVRLPHGNAWDRLRRLADEGLFPGYMEVRR